MLGVLSSLFEDRAFSEDVGGLMQIVQRDNPEAFLDDSRWEITDFSRSLVSQERDG